MGQYPELAGVWRPVCRMQWTDHASSGPRQWNGTYEERWDADGRCTYTYPHSGARGGGVVVVVSREGDDKYPRGTNTYHCRAESGFRCNAPHLILRTEGDWKHEWDFGGWGEEHWKRVSGGPGPGRPWEAVPDAGAGAGAGAGALGAVVFAARVVSTVHNIERAGEVAATAAASGACSIQ